MNQTNAPVLNQLNSKARYQRALLFLFITLVLVFLLSLLIGRYPNPPMMTPKQLLQDDLAQRVVFNLRLPRVITALLLGMALSAAGMVFQMIFTNPLVEPGFLGVSQGAAFGAALGIVLLGSSAVVIQFSAAFFAFTGLFASYILARRMKFGGWVLRLILSGIAISALFSAGVGVLKFVADPLTQLQEITFWLLGGLWAITWEKLFSILAIVLIGLFILFQMRWRLNLLSLDDQVSFSLGVLPSRERLLVLVAAVAITSAVISVSGMVSWIGLIIPHLSRRIFGANARYALPGAMLLGGIFTILSDDVARTLLTGEIPLGILTSFIGALFFIFLMISNPLKVKA
ncbi:MAG: iron ABC transporter permease [Anaerolineaceae bacterium]|nr:iron ABC transporter permease [Anaerolineaceae bacterium]